MEKVEARSPHPCLLLQSLRKHLKIKKKKSQYLFSPPHSYLIVWTGGLHMSIFSGSSSDSNMQLGLETTSGQDWITCVLSLNWPSEACVCCVYLTLFQYTYFVYCVSPKPVGASLVKCASHCLPASCSPVRDIYKLYEVKFRSSSRRIVVLAGPLLRVPDTSVFNYCQVK